MFSYFFTFFLALGQIGRISFLNQEVNIYIYDLLLIGWLIFLVIRYRATPLLKSVRTFRILYIFFGWLCLTFLLSLPRFTQTSNLIASFYLLRLTGYGAFFVYLSYHLQVTNSFRKLYLRSLQLFVGLTALFSVAQYTLYPNLRNLKYLGWDPHQYRIFGTFLDTSAAGAIFGLILIFLYFRRAVFPDKRLLYTLSGLYIILGLLTYSRAFYVSIFITIAWLLVVRRSYALLGGVAVFFVVALLLLPKPFGEGVNLLRTASIESRIVNDTEAVNLAKNNLLFGVGYNHLRYSRDSNIQNPAEPLGHSGASFHSSFLIILTTTGVVGLALFMLLLIRLGGISEVASHYLIFLSAFSLLDNVLLYPVVMVFFLLLLGLETGAKKAAIFRT